MSFASIAFLCLNSLSLATPIDTDLSTLKWTGQKPTSEHWGYLKFRSGDIVIKDDKWVGGIFTVDMTSMSVDDFSGGGADRLLKHLRSDDFFSVEQFETAKLRVNSNDNGTLKGKLTIKGKTHPISFSYDHKDNAYQGRMTFDRTLYDITYKSKSVIEGLGDKFIKDKVHVDFKIVLNSATRQ